MNATAGISPAKAQNCYLSRDSRPFASTIGTTHSLPAPSPWTLPAGQPSCERNCNTLLQFHREPSSLKDRRSPPPKKCLNRTMLCLSETSLSNFSLAEELIRLGNNLRDLDHTRVVPLNKEPFWEVDSKHKKNIIYNMYRFKDHGIEIALNDYPILREALTRFITLNLFNYIEVSISSLDQCLKLNGEPEPFNNFHDRMMTLSHNNKISFIADRVEHIESHSLA
ncbi:EAL domain-containing protein [Pseudomonas sp. CCM 7891]|uniref:EAL domain-containing protein n=1 Tax=Pseudomonas karstica TaxID=1055468 RepID=A0A7X2RXL4_9PSED|nr:EAL domain-containing protein [Pseudomonas karstica]MTD21910.1 EAL domain-containing protein [Pseudomonas karstica]